MPALSPPVVVEVVIGASNLVIKRNETDPRLFLSLPISVSNIPRATFTPSFLIDSGATHNILSHSYARRVGLLPHATPTRRTVSGFDGSTRPASFELSATLHNETSPASLIITTLKDSYNGILGMPWLRRNGHLIDWANCCFLPSVAAVSTASSSPPKPCALVSPRRDARIQTRGCVSTHPTQLEDTLAPPHCESCQPLNRLVSASQCALVKPTAQVPERTSWRTPPSSRITAELFPARTSWSTSARLAARTAAQAPIKSVEELVE